MKGARLLILFTASLCIAPTISGQTLESKLAKTVEAFDSESTTTEEQLVEFARRFQIPMGIELLYSASKKGVPPIRARNSTLQNVLRQIVHQQSGHDYRLSDGVVHVFPMSLTDDSLNFLNLRIPKYKIERESLNGAAYKLRISIKLVIHPESNIGGGYGGVGLNDDFHVPQITLSGNNLTVRQILNQIVALQGNASWVVRLNQWQMMTSEPFYAQTLSATTGDTAPHFHWEFIPLKKVVDNR